MEITTDFADPKLSDDGVWREYRNNSQIKIAGIGNAKFAADQERQRNSYSGIRRNREGRLPGDLETTILCRSMAKYILVDWKGFTRNGKTLKHSEKEAYTLLQSNVFFRNDIAAMSSEEGNFLKDAEDEDTKNSSSA